MIRLPWRRGALLRPREKSVPDTESGADFLLKRVGPSPLELAADDRVMNDCFDAVNEFCRGRLEPEQPGENGAKGFH